MTKFIPLKNDLPKQKIFDESRKFITTKSNLFLFYCVLFLPLITVLSCLFLLTYYSREFFTTSDGLKQQLKNSGLYGRSTINDTAYFKLKLTEAIQPKILAIGNSRTMQFRNAFFTKDSNFVTAGGAMQNLEEGLAFFKRLNPDIKFSTVIIGLEFWWFNAERPVEGAFQWNDRSYDSYFYVVGASIPFAKSLWQKIRSLPALDSLANKNPGLIGSRAAAYEDGFRLDGSHRAGGYAKGIGELDKDYEFTKQRIKSEILYMEGGIHISSKAEQDYQKLLFEIKKRTDQIVVFWPPFAPQIKIFLLQSPRHEIVAHFADFAKDFHARNNIPFYDFSRVPFEDRKCFIDGIHANQFVYGWMVSNMESLRQFKSNELETMQKDVNRYCELMED